MDDFFKTKVGFVIGLMAAIFAFKPLIDSNADVGFVILDTKITIELAFIVVTSFLGLSVYFISLQFISSKHLKILDLISTVCYAVALTTPPTFLFLWGAIVVTSFFDNIVNSIPERNLDYVAAFLTVLFSIISANITYHSIRSQATKLSELSFRKDIYQKLNSHADSFLKGQYNSVIESLILTLKEVFIRHLKTAGIKIGSTQLANLIKLIEENQILTSEELDILKLIKGINENRLKDPSYPNEISAFMVLSFAQDITERFFDDRKKPLTFYLLHWILDNSRVVINAILVAQDNHAKDLIKLLLVAWKQRDGAAGLELGKIFKVCLLHKTKIFVETFATDKDSLEEWLAYLPHQMFTVGVSRISAEDKQDFIMLKTDILNSLNELVEHNEANEFTAIVQQIFNYIKEIEISQLN